MPRPLLMAPLNLPRQEAQRPIVNMFHVKQG